MSNYTRSTRECTFDQLRPELRRAVLDYARAHELGGLESEIIRCCETRSEKKPDNWLSAWLDGKTDQVIYTGSLFTADWLVWARSGDVSGVSVTVARLKDIQVKNYASIFTPDHGLEIYGYLGEANQRVRGYIGMGPESATQSFCDGVRQAVEKINPPTKKFPSWMGG